ncbi:uncharacterized protein LOC144095259 [Amblyomma americanum]
MTRLFNRAQPAMPEAAKPEKCHFALRELKFLGHIVIARGVSPDPEKTAAVAAFPKPTDKRSLRRFLGLCAYYRRFVHTSSKLAEPLTPLTKNTEPFFWGQDQERAFTELKCRLQCSPLPANRGPTPNCMLLLIEYL